MSAALSKLLKRVELVSEDSAVTPATYFAASFVAQAARRGRSKSWLLLQHLPLSTVLNLVKVAPERFGGMALVTQVFDASSPSGRRNMAKAMCLLRNVREKREAMIADM